MKYKISDEEKKALTIWIIMGIIITLLAGLIDFKIVKNKKEEEKLYNLPYTYVKDYSRYYTVIGALEKYYSFVNSKNYESVLNILSNNYKNSNNINKDNINKYIEDYDINISYKPGKMCYKNIKKGIVSYYLSGNIIGMNSSKFLDEKYYNIILDGNDLHFTLEPISKELFEGECHD